MNVSAIATTSLAAAVLLQSVAPAAGMIHNLNIYKDSRPVFQIESFAFREGGVMNLTASHFSVSVGTCLGWRGASK